MVISHYFAIYLDMLVIDFVDVWLFIFLSLKGFNLFDGFDPNEDFDILLFGC